MTRLGTRRRPLGGTGLEVSGLTVGTSALGSPERPEALVQQTLAAALSSPLAALDTGNNYGLAEERVGRALSAADGLPPGRLVVTKADPAPGSDDFSGDRVRHSVEESLQRIGLDTLPLVHLHDPERIRFGDAMAPGGPVAALISLRDEGIVGHIGVAGGPAAMMERYVRTDVFEAVVTHNRFTLLDRSSDALLDACAERGLGVFNAAPYGGGLLAGRPGNPPRYAYRPATPEHLRAVAAMEALLRPHGVELAAAALQLSLRDPRITSTIVGVSTPQQLATALAWSEQPIPDDLWPHLAALCPPERVWLGPDGR